MENGGVLCGVRFTVVGSRFDSLAGAETRRAGDSLPACRVNVGWGTVRSCGQVVTVPCPLLVENCEAVVAAMEIGCGFAVTVHVVSSKEAL